LTNPGRTTDDKYRKMNQMSKNNTHNKKLHTMAFVNNFLKTLAIPLGDLAKWLEEEHNVPVLSTIEKWNEISGMNVTINDTGATCADVENQIITIGSKTVVKSAVSTPLDSTLCQHVFIAGNRKGQQCNIRPKKGNDRCSAHKKKQPKSPEIVVESDSEAETSKPVPKPVPKNVVKAKKSDSEAETSKPVPRRVNKRVNKRVVKAKKSDSETETFTPLRKPPKKVVPDSSDDDDDDNDEPKSIFDPENKEDPKAVVAKLLKKRVSESSTDDSGSGED